MLEWLTYTNSDGEVKQYFLKVIIFHFLSSKGANSLISKLSLYQINSEDDLLLIFYQNVNTFASKLVC